MPKIVLIAHNVRSAHNVGSLLRTAEGLGINKVYLTGYTPHPKQANDARLPHVIRKTEAKIAKTSLGAESTVESEFIEDIFKLIKSLRSDKFTICALEQDDHAVSLPKYHPPENIALIVGREVEGVEPEVLQSVDQVLQIPMFGKKESFNVAQAAAMALYHLKFS